jgi:hypothetical protein
MLFYLSTLIMGSLILQFPNMIQPYWLSYLYSRGDIQSEA